MEGGIWPTKNFWRGAPYARPLAGRGKGREGRGTEREERGRKQETGNEGKLEQGRRLAKASPANQQHQYTEGIMEHIGK